MSIGHIGAAGMTLSDFIDDWKKQALNAVAPEVKWCPVCETRERRKAFSPYCSQICLEAAERKELMDRR